MQPVSKLEVRDEFTRFAEAMREIVWRTRADGAPDYYNPAWYRYTGLSPAIPAAEIDRFAYLHPDDVERARSRFRAALDEHRSYRIEYRLRGADGRYRWFASSANIVLDHAGRPDKWYGLLVDIDEERRARESVRTLMEAFPGMAWLADARGRVEYVNAGYLAFTGLSYDAALDPAVRLSIVHPDDLPAGRAAWEAALAAGEPLEHQFRCRSASGDFRWMLGRAQPVRDPDGAVVSWAGTAVDVEDLHRTSELFEALSSTAPTLVWMTRIDGFVEYWNGRMVDYTGMAPDRIDGIAWDRMVHPEDLEATAQTYAAAMRDGRPFEIQNRLRRHDGVYRWFLARAEPVRDAAGAPLRYVGTATDIDDRKRAEDAMALLLEASTVLASAREIDALLPEVMRICVDRGLAKIAALFLGRAGALDLVALDAADTADERLMREQIRRYPHRASDGVSGVVATGKPAVYPIVPEGWREARAYDARHREMLETLDLHSMIVVPLQSAGKTLGAIQLIRAAGDEPFTPDGDLRTAEVLARRVAGAIDEARTRDTERRLAETFQASALPRRLPSPGGIEIRAVYQAAEVGINVGGDWYDAFEISPWRLVLSCGDVAGKGVDAAAIMSLLRHGIRFAAFRGADPADILAAVDAALAAEYADVTATAFVAILDIRESRIRYASAGHPPAILRLPTGGVKTLEADPAPPLGAWPPGFRPAVASTALAYGTILALYTDGATEIERDPVAGEARLLAVLRDEAIVASTDAARYLLRGALEGKTARDDTAIVTLVFGRRRDWTFSADDALRAQSASPAFERWLREETAGDIGAAMTIFAELVGNVVRHAPGRIEIRGERRTEDVVLHVLDEGAGFVAKPSLPEDLAEGGRGLYIVSRLARAYRVEASSLGSYLRVVLPLTPRPRSAAPPPPAEHAG